MYFDKKEFKKSIKEFITLKCIKIILWTPLPETLAELLLILFMSIMLSIIFYGFFPIFLLIMLIDSFKFGKRK